MGFISGSGHKVLGSDSTRTFSFAAPSTWSVFSEPGPRQRNARPVPAGSLLSCISLQIERHSPRQCLCPDRTPAFLAMCPGEVLVPIGRSLPFSRIQDAAEEKGEKIEEKSGWRRREAGERGTRKPETNAREERPAQRARQIPRGQQKRHECSPGRILQGFLPQTLLGASAVLRPGFPGHEGLQGAAGSPPPLAAPPIPPSRPTGPGRRRRAGAFRSSRVENRL